MPSAEDPYDTEQLLVEEETDLIAVQGADHTPRSPTPALVNRGMRELSPSTQGSCCTKVDWGGPRPELDVTRAGGGYRLERSRAREGGSGPASPGHVYPYLHPPPARWV